MKTATASGDPSDDSIPILLFRPVTAMTLGKALGKNPFEVVKDLMELDHFVTTRQEIGDEIISDYSRAQKFEFVILDRPDSMDVDS